MDLNEAMEKAVAHLSGDEGDTETPAEPVIETEAAPTETAPTETPAQAAERARDEAGKFTKAPKPKAAKATEKPAGTAPKGGVHGATSAAPPAAQGTVDGASPPLVPSTAPASSDIKPPSSLRPAAKEAFAKAPREVQEDIVRIDREVRQVMQQTAEARKTAESVQRTLAPFEGLARSQGMDSMQYAGSVLQTAAALHMGTPAQKAAVVAQIIGSYGVDLDAINVALQGQPVPQQAHQPQIDPRQEIRSLLEQERAEQARQANLTEAQRFVESSPEFLPYVEQDMVEILRLDRAKGGNLTPQQAYDRACKLNDEVQDVIAKRKAAEAARTRTAATVQARTAAVSLKGSPAAPMSGAKPKGLDAAMNAAREKLGL